MRIIINDIKNKIDFFLRNTFYFSRKNYSEKNENKTDLFSVQELIKKEAELIEKYSIEDLKTNSSKRNYIDNLYTLDVLDRFLKIDSKERLKVLDIGCKNWFYAKAQWYFFNKFTDNLQLDGIELDPNRLYTNLFSRKEVAKFYTKNLSNTNYICNDFLNHNTNYDYMIWILPFVFEDPLLMWGLPIKHFKPEQMLAHAYKYLNQDGKIFIINQGEAEYEKQIELCENLNVKYTKIGEIDSCFLEYNPPRYGLIIHKN